MKSDPIVAAVRAIRDELAAQCGYDIKRMFRELREQQADSGRTYVCYPARRIASTENRKASEADATSNEILQ